MITVNSVSGGKTSAYIAANYKADYNVFSLVRTSDKGCLFPDSFSKEERYEIERLIDRNKNYL